MWSEFKKFAFKGNVMDMAVGVMIGAAFNGIVSSIVNDVFMPLFGLIFDTTDLSTKFIVLKGVEGVELSGMTAADAAAAGATVLSYGKFIASIINFFIIALVIFFMVKLINKLKELGKKPEEAEPAKEPRICPYCNFKSCTSVPFVARRRTLAARARLTIRYRPSGIMPMTAAAVVSTPSRTDRPSREVCR